MEPLVGAHPFDLPLISKNHRPCPNAFAPLMLLRFHHGSVGSKACDRYNDIFWTSLPLPSSYMGQLLQKQLQGVIDSPRLSLSLTCGPHDPPAESKSVKGASQWRRRSSSYFCCHPSSLWPPRISLPCRWPRIWRTEEVRRGWRAGAQRWRSPAGRSRVHGSDSTGLWHGRNRRRTSGRGGGKRWIRAPGGPGWG